jgi:hypothetical protein
MNIDLTVIKNTGRERDCDLKISQFNGGSTKGLMIQLTQDFGAKMGFDEPGFIQLTRIDACKLIDEIKDFAYKKFYMTLGSGQPHYPGYFIAIAANEYSARLLTSNALNERWCSTYEEFDEIHPMDRIYRGEITENGIVLSSGE